MDDSRKEERLQKAQGALSRIKQNVKNAHEYFKPNYDRFNEFRKFVFESSLSSEEVTLLTTISKPQLEFNVLEAYVSRLLGEFSKQEPDIMVSADNESNADPLTIKIVEQHLRHTASDHKNHHVRYEVYKDLLSGGFSSLKVTTDYASPMSMHQVININRAYDPTLCGYDELARYSHKGDGRFCFELFPVEKEDFMEDHPDIPLGEITFRRDFAGFNWSYVNDMTQIVLVADYYEKVPQRKKIVMLSDGKVMTHHRYKKMLDEWGDFSAPPTIVGRPRETKVDKIVRYRLIENRIIEYVETDFAHFPLVFVDGNSVLVKTKNNGNIKQVTRPYVYHAKGAQKLKNYAGIALAGEIENIVQHKFIIKKEALPKEEEWLAAIKDIQKPSNIVVNAFYEENPDQPIPEPIREIMKIPAPPETLQAFSGSDSLIQNILGSYDASLGINNNQLSGIAVVESASQSNAAAMPYIVGFMQGYQRAAEIYVDLLPKYYTTPRTLPVMDEDGKRSHIRVNQPEGFDMFFDTNALNVIVKAGASFQVQKSRTLMMVKEMMGMSPLFAQFIAEKGLNFVLDNMEGRGVEQLKVLTDGWVREYEMQKQQAMQQQQQASQMNPAVLRAQTDQAKLQFEQKKFAAEQQMDIAKLQQEQVKAMAEMRAKKNDDLVQIMKANTERFAKEADLQLRHHDMRHRHYHDMAELFHKTMQSAEGQ